MPRVKLAEVAHARTGEKGDLVNLSVFAYRPEHWEVLRAQLTAERVRERYAGLLRGSVERYESPGVHGLNFVLHGALGGGRSRTLAFDESGKALSAAVLDVEIDVPEGPLRRDGLRYAQGSPPPADQRSVRIGMGAAWWGDRLDTPVDLIRRGILQYICFDSMSEVTQSAHQVWREQDPSTPPYAPLLVERFTRVLPEAVERGVTIITNQGWLDPLAAAERVQRLARELGLPPVRIAAVTTNDLMQAPETLDLRLDESGKQVREYGERVVSAEVYLGGGAIAEALDRGAQVVITPRVADSALALGPLLHEYRWAMDDWDRVAAGSIVGHLIECGAQITGGYFADPGFKDVAGMTRLSLPIATVAEDGHAWISKLPDSGGEMSPATGAEQLLYETSDPARYLLPDVSADLSGVSFRQVDADTVQVLGMRGDPRPDTLKALVGIREGYLAEEMLCYAGSNALARAELAREILQERFRALPIEDLRIDFIGVNAIHREASPPRPDPYEIVVRIAAKTATREAAESVRREVDPMAVNGPAATGKWSPAGRRVRPLIGLQAAFVPREQVSTEVHLLG